MLRKARMLLKGGIIEIEKPIHVSNLKVCVEEDTAVKLKVRTNEQGDRQFIYKTRTIKKLSIVQ